VPQLKPDHWAIQMFNNDRRAPERLIAHYVMERAFANRLVTASQADRAEVYGQVYSELFRSLPDHPQKTRARTRETTSMMQSLCLLKQYLTPEASFLEIGCGDAALAFEAAERVGVAFALDVTDELIDFRRAPKNFRFLRTAGRDIPLASESIDVAYSNQLMEHLHPDDAKDQLREIVRVLKPGALYRCITPSRVTGPHDISCYFDDSATGLHLQEYDSVAMKEIFRSAGFRQVKFCVSVKDTQIFMPHWLLRSMELLLLAMPPDARGKFARVNTVRLVAGLDVIGIK